MRVMLIHNPAAGEGDQSEEEILRTLRLSGDEIIPISSHDPGFEDRLNLHGIDLLVVAGGDGTVGKVARRTAGGAVPVLIAPVGTANNIASSLGIEKPNFDLGEVMKSWRRQSMDTGIIDGEIVVEAAGCGVIAEFMNAASDDEREGVKRETKSLGQFAETFPLFDYEVVIDGETLRGEALVVEVMVISQMGPNIVLAAGTPPGDGALDLVIIGAEERDGLLRYLHSGGRLDPPPFPRLRARSVTLFSEAPWHVDDESRRPGKRTISVFPNAWQVLVPPGRLRGD